MIQLQLRLLCKLFSMVGIVSALVCSPLTATQSAPLSFSACAARRESHHRRTATERLLLSARSGTRSKWQMLTLSKDVLHSESDVARQQKIRGRQVRAYTYQQVSLWQERQMGSLGVHHGIVVLMGSYQVLRRKWKY